MPPHCVAISAKASVQTASHGLLKHLRTGCPAVAAATGAGTALASPCTGSFACGGAVATCTVASSGGRRWPARPLTRRSIALSPAGGRASGRSAGCPGAVRAAGPAARAMSIPLAHAPAPATGRRRASPAPAAGRAAAGGVWVGRYQHHHSATRSGPQRPARRCQGRRGSGMSWSAVAGIQASHLGIVVPGRVVTQPLPDSGQGATRAPPLQQNAHHGRSRVGASGSAAAAGKGRFGGRSAQFDCLIKRPDADWIGRAFIGYRRENTLIWSVAIGTGCCITSHSTPSLHGGVVNEPM